MKIYLRRLGESSLKSVGLPFDILATVLVLSAVACLYWQVLGHQFVAWDDTSYVSENRRVLSGLSWGNVQWAFGTFQVSNWHPLTLLSHMLDVEMWGLRPGMHAATNVAIHMANSALLYAFFSRVSTYMQGGSLGRLPALLFSLLFAVHPLHVESVAWISQRKDMLCAFFWLLAMHAYLTYRLHRTVLGYLSVTAFMVLSLLSKPMAVTLPLVLCVIDWWQLKRSNCPPWPALMRLGVEKIPWLVLSAAVAYLTIVAQTSAMPVFNSFERLQIAISAYGWYLRKALFPTDLHFYYLTENAWDISHLAIGFILLLSASWFVYRRRNDRPELLAGWLCYLITLLPVVGFIKVGTQAWADRYVYLPHVGLFLIGVSAAMSVPANRQARRLALLAIVALLFGFAWTTWRQISVWKDTSTLYQNALSKEPQHYVAMMGLANHSLKTRDYLGARTYALKALELSAGPSLVRSMHSVLGELELAAGNLSEAIQHFESGRDTDGSNSEIRLSLGRAYLQAGRLHAAEAEYREALRLDSTSADALNGLGVALGVQKRFDEALQHMEKALEFAPKRRDIHNNMATLALQSGDRNKARSAYLKMLLLDPEDARARAALAELTDQ
jgi:protein O-mannosyl-transferase